MLNNSVHARATKHNNLDTTDLIYAVRNHTAALRPQLKLFCVEIQALQQLHDLCVWQFWPMLPPDPINAIYCNCNLYVIYATVVNQRQQQTREREESVCSCIQIQKQARN